MKPLNFGSNEMIARKATYRILTVLLIGLLLNACIEPFDVQTSASFESALVVEATITNEEKQQVIRLSRAYQLDTLGPNAESNAQIRVLDDLQNEFNFQETEPGIYISGAAFAASEGRSYRLSITTANGRTYSSETQVLAKGAEIANVYPVRENNGFGEDGIAIYLDTQGDGTSSSYFRYEYEETFKIVAPFWAPEDVAIVNDEWPDFEYELVPRTNGPVCYGNRSSTRIVLANTDGQEANKLERFEIKFLDSDDYVISHRYSILVKQYAQSSSAYSYYQTLRDFSQAENFFSDNQPGFLEGNVFSEDDRNEKVIGFFDVSGVTTKRMFFNYTDFYPDAPLPPYITACNGVITAPCPGCSGGGSAGCVPSLIYLIREERAVYLTPTTPENFQGGGLMCSGPYIMIPFNCGDCTKLGTNTVPDFWVE